MTASTGRASLWQSLDQIFTVLQDCEKYLRAGCTDSDYARIHYFLQKISAQVAYVEAIPHLSPPVPSTAHATLVPRTLSTDSVTAEVLAKHNTGEVITQPDSTSGTADSFSGGVRSAQDIGNAVTGTSKKQTAVVNINAPMTPPPSSPMPQTSRSTRASTRAAGANFTGSTLARPSSSPSQATSRSTRASPRAAGADFTGSTLARPSSSPSQASDIVRGAHNLMSLMPVEPTRSSGTGNEYGVKQDDKEQEMRAAVEEVNEMVEGSDADGELESRDNISDIQSLLKQTPAESSCSPSSRARTPDKVVQTKTAKAAFSTKRGSPVLGASAQTVSTTKQVIAREQITRATGRLHQPTISEQASPLRHDKRQPPVMHETNSTGPQPRRTLRGDTIQSSFQRPIKRTAKAIEAEAASVPGKKPKTHNNAKATKQLPELVSSEDGNKERPPTPDKGQAIASYDIQDVEDEVAQELEDEMEEGPVIMDTTMSLLAQEAGYKTKAVGSEIYSTYSQLISSSRRTQTGKHALYIQRPMSQEIEEVIRTIIFAAASPPVMKELYEFLKYSFHQARPTSSSDNVDALQLRTIMSKLDGIDLLDFSNVITRRWCLAQLKPLREKLLVQVRNSKGKNSSTTSHSGNVRELRANRFGKFKDLRLGSKWLMQAVYPDLHEDNKQEYQRRKQTLYARLNRGKVWTALVNEFGCGILAVISLSPRLGLTSTRIERLKAADVQVMLEVLRLRRIGMDQRYKVIKTLSSEVAPFVRRIIGEDADKKQLTAQGGTKKMQMGIDTSGWAEWNDDSMNYDSNELIELFKSARKASELEK